MESLCFFITKQRPSYWLKECKIHSPWRQFRQLSANIVWERSWISLDLWIYGKSMTVSDAISRLRVRILLSFIFYLFTLKPLNSRLTYRSDTLGLSTKTGGCDFTCRVPELKANLSIVAYPQAPNVEIDTHGGRLALAISAAKSLFLNKSNHFKSQHNVLSKQLFQNKFKL